MGWEVIRNKGSCFIILALLPLFLSAHLNGAFAHLSSHRPRKVSHSLLGKIGSFSPHIPVTSLVSCLKVTKPVVGPTSQFLAERLMAWRCFWMCSRKWLSSSGFISRGHGRLDLGRGSVATGACAMGRNASQRRGTELGKCLPPMHHLRSRKRHGTRPVFCLLGCPGVDGPQFGKHRFSGITKMESSARLGGSVGRTSGA